MKIPALLITATLFAGVASITTFSAVASSNSPPTISKPVTFKVITWDALLPKDWDPFKDFRGQNLGGMNDGNPKALQMMRDLRAAWDNAPTVAAMDGAAVKLPGYLVPLDESKEGLKEFLLVPYFGACIHSPPPPANQIVHVVTNKAIKGFRTMDTIWVSGKLSSQRQDSIMGKSGYRLDAVVVERYVEKRR